MPHAPSHLTLGASVGEMWFLTALGSFTIMVHHKPGAELLLADAHSYRVALDYVQK